MRVGVCNPGPDVMYPTTTAQNVTGGITNPVRPKALMWEGFAGCGSGFLIAKSPGFCQINDGLAQPSRRFLEQSNRRRPLCDPQQEPSQQSKQ